MEPAFVGDRLSSIHEIRLVISSCRWSVD